MKRKNPHPSFQTHISIKDHISTHHLKQCHSIIAVLLTILFNAILSHNYIPLEMMDTVLTPIVKDNRGDLTDRNNYRPIALTNIISKDLNW